MHAEILSDIPDIADVQLARARIGAWTRTTPVLNDPGLDEKLLCTLFCKCENFQRTGSFKFRGASNAISRLREENIEGDVATHSSGNHGAALALAAKLDQRKAHVVMPHDSVPMKVESVRRYGGIVHFCASTHESREKELEKLIAEGKIPVHPYDHADIIAGQGTAALELFQQEPNLSSESGNNGREAILTIMVNRSSWIPTVKSSKSEPATDSIYSIRRRNL